MDGARFRNLVGVLGRPATTVWRVGAMGHVWTAPNHDRYGQLSSRQHPPLGGAVHGIGSGRDAMFGDSNLSGSFSFRVKPGKGNCRLGSSLGITAIAVDEN